MNTLQKTLTRLVVVGAILIAGIANAQLTVSDNFTGATNTMSWKVIGPACLTAGTTATADGNQIPKCTPGNAVNNGAIGEGGDGLNNCSDNQVHASGCIASGVWDGLGHGALRLTNAQDDQHSAIVWNSTFPSTQGISVTFSAVSYNGDGYNGDGADGMSFFLLDGSAVTAAAANGQTNPIGSFGGSLAYTCSNSESGNNPYTGAISGYIGLGIDEYGNFLNAGDNTATGVGVPNATTGIGSVLYGGNGAGSGSGGGSNSNIYTNPPGMVASVQRPQRIGVRGIGQINWYQLNSNFSTFYPANYGSPATAVGNTCASGTVWNYSGNTINNVSTGNVSGASFTGTISSHTTLTVQHGTLAAGSSILVGQPITGTGVVSGQSICAVGTAVTSSVNGTYTLCTSQTSVGSETMNVPACTTGLASCGSTVGNVASGSNMNCAVMMSNNLPVTYAQLSAANSVYYPSSLNAAQQNAALVSTCATGTMWNYSNPASATNTLTVVSNVVGQPGYVAGSNTLYDYIPLNNANLVFPELISTTLAGARNNATARSYNLKITPNGLLSLTYADIGPTGVPNAAVPVLTNSPIFSSNGPLPSSFTFGFGGSTGGSVNIHEITCFQAAPANASDSSAAGNVVQTGQIQTNTQVFLAYYHTNDWWGQLTSQSLQVNPTTGAVSINSTATWDDACVLTGDNGAIAAAPNSGNTSTLTSGSPAGSCASTGNVTTDVAESQTSRTILTNDGTTAGGTAYAFEYATLPAALTGLLNNDGNGAIRAAYLRGDRSNEVNPTATTGSGGIFRTRIGVLGDIVDSSPTWVGQPSQSYPSSLLGSNMASWVDLLGSAADTTMPENVNSYGAFQATAAVGARTNVVYVGANDGFLHAFENGYYNSSGTYVSTNNDGKEILAYMPYAVLSTIHSSTAIQDYSSPSYAHNYYVDATPGTADLYFNNAWHSWLVGGLGAGGKAIYVLDITNPASFSELAPATTVVGEWSASNTSTLGNNLGYTFGTPQIKRFHSGDWAVVFGNGYNSVNGVAGIFLGVVNHTSGKLTFTFLSTGVGSPLSPNGIFYATPEDFDGDNIVDYIYAGDLQGNVWRWDVTAMTTSGGAVAGVPAPFRLFTTPSSTPPNTQPITTQIEVLAVANPGGNPRIMIDFGTGSQIQQSSALPTLYANGQQALYGIWDGKFSAWNALSPAYQYDTYPTAAVLPVPATTLQTQTIPTGSTSTGVDAGVNYTSLTNNPVCWADASAISGCSSYTQYGWTYALHPTAAGATGEQIVFNPTVVNNVFVVNSYIPATAQACTVSNPTGWTIAVNPANGGALSTTFFSSSSTVALQAIANAAALAAAAVEAAAANPTAANIAAANTAIAAYDTAAGVTAGTTITAANVSSQVTTYDSISATAANNVLSSSSINKSQEQLSMSGTPSFADAGSHVYVYGQTLGSTTSSGSGTTTEINLSPNGGLRLNWQQIR